MTSSEIEPETFKKFGYLPTCKSVYMSLSAVKFDSDVLKQVAHDYRCLLKPSGLWHLVVW
jgi:hypothetical protein